MPDQLTTETAPAQNEDQGFDIDTIKQLLFAAQSNPQQPVEAIKSVLSQMGRGKRFFVGFANPRLASELRAEDANAATQNQRAALTQSQQRLQTLGALGQILNQEGITDRAGRQLAINEASESRSESGFETAQKQAEATLRRTEQLTAASAGVEERAAASAESDIASNDALTALRKAQTEALTGKINAGQDAASAEFDSIEQSVGGISELSNGLAQALREADPELGGFMAQALELKQQMLGAAINRFREQSEDPEVAKNITETRDEWMEEREKAQTALGGGEKEKLRLLPPGEIRRSSQRTAGIKALLSAQDKLEVVKREMTALGFSIDTLMPDLMREPVLRDLLQETNRVGAETRRKIFGARLEGGEEQLGQTFIPLINGFEGSLAAYETRLKGQIAAEGRDQMTFMRGFSEFDTQSFDEFRDIIKSNPNSFPEISGAGARSRMQRDGAIPTNRRKQ